MQYTYSNYSANKEFLPNHQDVVLEPGASIVNSFIYGGFYLERHSMVNRSTLYGPSGLGSFSYVADTDIGPFVNIGARVSVGGHEHPQDWLSTSAFQWVDKTYLLGKGLKRDDWGKLEEKPISAKTLIQADVWIGSNSIIKAGVSLGVGSIVGAGSVVTKNTEPYGIYFGNPAVLKKFRFSKDIRSKLLESVWWELPIEFLLHLPFKDVTACIEIVKQHKESKKCN